jgi:hypothetical protein
LAMAATAKAKRTTSQASKTPVTSFAATTRARRGSRSEGHHAGALTPLLGHEDDPEDRQQDAGRVGTGPQVEVELNSTSWVIDTIEVISIATEVRPAVTINNHSPPEC